MGIVQDPTPRNDTFYISSMPRTTPWRLWLASRNDCALVEDDYIYKRAPTPFWSWIFYSRPLVLEALCFMVNHFMCVNILSELEIPGFELMASSKPLRYRCGIAASILQDNLAAGNI